jgi:protein SERAC1
MTKFKSLKDAGYVRVHDRLWLWYNMVEESQDEWKEKKYTVKRQQQRLLQHSSNSSHGETSYHGPVFNGSISGHNLIAGPHVTGGSTANFNFS